VVSEAVANLMPLADRKQQTLRLLPPPALPAIQADPQRLTQVLVNLIGNAIKFTPERGSIEVSIGREGPNLRIEVSDTGIGIHPKDLPKLFKPFSQLGSGNTRDTTGTGLGLSITKALVEAHGGSVGVHSQPNRGSRFWVLLPYDEGRDFIHEVAPHA
ncbi:MAG: sensor histidine kinase, partial [Candidatus Sericytochromatia bacterium]